MHLPSMIISLLSSSSALPAEVQSIRTLQLMALCGPVWQFITSNIYKHACKSGKSM